MTTAIVNATIIDGTGRDPVPNGTVILEGYVIDRIGAGIEPPRGANVIDAGGATVMPGMIDCHVHLFGKVAPWYERLQLPSSLQLFHGAKNALRTLDSGFTAVRDAGGSPAGFKMAIEQGLIPGPRMRTAVVHLSQTGGHGDSTLPSGSQAGRISGAERMPGSLLPQSIRKSHEVAQASKDSVRAAKEAGVRIAFGTDMGVGPHGRNAEELELMVAAGLTPMEATVAVTKTASECIHMADQIGTLEPGKLADLLIVDGDPLADIGILKDRARLKLIMQGGRTHKNALDVGTKIGV